MHRDFILDTNMLLHFVRGSTLAKQVVADYLLFQKQQLLFISVVSVGEIQSIATRRRWGGQKIQKLNILLEQLEVIRRFTNKIVQAYVDIDTYSQGKHPTLALPKGMTARNMGKNDLWIAATARALGITLLTTDKDFTHLSSKLLQLQFVNG